MAIADPLVVASVAGRAITQPEVEARLEELRRGPRGRHVPPGDGPEVDVLRRWIVRELAKEAIARHEAMAAGLSEEHEAGSETPGPPTADEVGRLVAHVTAGVRVPEQEVRAYYDRNGDLFRLPESRRVRHVLVADEQEARDIARRIRQGEGMTQLARERSIDAGSRDRGGDLGEVGRGELSGPLEAALFAADPGDVVGPIRTEHGWHVARIEAATKAGRVPYEAARDAIEADLLAAARLRVFDAWLERRLAELAVFEPGYEHPGDPVRGVRTHRH